MTACFLYVDPADVPQAAHNPASPSSTAVTRSRQTPTRDRRAYSGAGSGIVVGLVLVPVVPGSDRAVLVDSSPGEAVVP